MEILSVKDLTFGYGDCPVLDRFSCAINEGDFCLIEGGSGAGKTTLMKCLTSLVNQGVCVYYRGQELARNRHLLANMAWVMGEDGLYDYLTVEENIGFYRAFFGEGIAFSRRVHQILEDVGCTRYLDHLVRNLSREDRGKVCVAIMLSKRADVLLLDEPFTALDQRDQTYFCELLRQQNRQAGKTVVLVTELAPFRQLATSRIEIVKKEA